MILIALILHKLGHYSVLWIGKSKLQDIRLRVDGIRFLFEMNGSIVNFLVGFLLIFTFSLTSVDRYLPNDAVRGMQVSEAAKKIGFEDGDKIISINERIIDRFGSIEEMIFVESLVKVNLKRNDSLITIYVNDNDKFLLIRDKNSFVPIKNQGSIRSDIHTLFIGISGSVSGAFKSYTDSFEILKKLLLLPLRSQKVSGPIGVTKSLKGYLYQLALACNFLWLINLLPIPGLDLGNVLIAFIERKREKAFNYMMLYKIRIICSTILVAVILSYLYISGIGSFLNF